MIYLRCIRFNKNRETNSVRDSIKIGAKDLSVLEFGTPDIVWCAPDPDCPVSQRSNGSLRANGRLCRATVRNSTTTEVKAQKLEGTGLSGVAPDCTVQQDDKRLQRSTAPNPNGRADVALTGQCTVTVRWRTRLSSASIASSPC
jgi:hypothetical protein